MGMSVAGYPQYKGVNPQKKIKNGALQGVGSPIRHLPAGSGSPLVFSRLDIVLQLDWTRWDESVMLALLKPTSL